MAALLWNLKAKFFHLNTTQISLHDVESYKLSVRRKDLLGNTMGLRWESDLIINQALYMLSNLNLITIICDVNFSIT